jgi:hypothetical protein
MEGLSRSSAPEELLAAQRKRLGACAKWKNSRGSSEGAAGLRASGRPVASSNGLSGRCNFLCEPNVLVMFGVTHMARRTSRLHPAAILVENAIMPTLERREHGLIERLIRPIADEAGGSARPYRAVDTLAVMERRGSITASMRQAGEDFRARFATAQLDPLRALDYSRPRDGGASRRNGGDEPGMWVEGARAAVWRAVLALGGLGSPGGSCLWHVVGWERSLKDWALQQGWSGRRVSQEAASGILIAALGALEAHYRQNDIAKI